ncbi:MAG: ATP-binding protein [Phycisphaerae bacterium]
MKGIHSTIERHPLPPSSGNRTPKWHYLYFILAAFDLVTVTFSLFVTHSLMEVYSSSVDTNHIWADRLRRYSHLALMAADVNAPGNDVFETPDVEVMSGRLAKTFSRFNEHLTEARSDLRNNVSSELGTPLLKDLDKVEQAILSMVEASQNIFHYFNENRRDEAGAQMATMDQQFYEATKAANSLIQKVQAIQEKHFSEQASAAGSMRQFEYLIAGLIVLMVLGVTAYGLKISRHIQASAVERERMEEALRVRTTAIEAAGDTIMVTSRDGIIEYVNPAFTTAVGYTPEEAIGRRTAIFKSGKHDKAFYEKLWGTVLAGKDWHGEMINRRRDGSLYPEEMTISPVKDVNGEVIRFIAIKRDITVRKQAEEMIRRHSEILEREVEERTAELEAAKEKAEASNRAKSTFLANVSHELRTPLHGILSFAGFGINKYDIAEPEKLLSYFRRIHQSGRTLLSLLNDLLDMAKLESGTMTFVIQQSDLCDLVDSVMEEFGAMAAEREIQIRSVEPEVRVVAKLDAEKMKQVIRNLLSNAVKFSPVGGTIEVSLCQTEESVVISVRDQGPGVPEDELDMVFDKFVQSSRTRTGAGGTGLGLSICRQLMTAMDGRIWAESNVECGAIFSAEVPISMTLNKEIDGVQVEIKQGMKTN